MKNKGRSYVAISLLLLLITAVIANTIINWSNPRAWVSIFIILMPYSLIVLFVFLKDTFK
ncbi:hypothetical protein FIU87_19425 [Bacillus sp. THAF10]|nr:hypothetical protein FIU87_19425 [Bacillus sp. THAF10]